MKQSRWRSATAWTSVVGLIYFTYVLIAQREAPEILKLLELLVATLIGFGVFNNPTDKYGY